MNVRETERPVARSFFDWCAERIAGYVPGAIEYPAAGERFRVSPSSFFQVTKTGYRMKCSAGQLHQ